MQHSLAARTTRDDASMYLEGRRKQIKRGAIRHTILSDVSMTFERGLAEVRHAYAGHPRATAPPAPVHRGFRRPAHAKTTPARWRVRGLHEREKLGQADSRQAESGRGSRVVQAFSAGSSPLETTPKPVVASTTVYRRSIHESLHSVRTDSIPCWARVSETSEDQPPSRWYEGIGEWLYLDRNGLVATPFSLSSSIRFRMIERVFGNFWKEDWKGRIGNVILINLGYFFEILSILWVDLFFVAFTHSSFSLHSCWWHWEIFGHMDRFGSIRFHISFCI